MKKLINDPNAVAAETIEGLALAYPHILKKLDGIQAVARNDVPVPGKVAVLTGGGSGHEPLFAGYVGRGLPDASVAGNIFASPPPIPIMSAAQQVHSGRGVLLLYGNYSGDILNFDVAAEELMADGIEVVTVRISDDVAPHRGSAARSGEASRAISSSSRSLAPRLRNCWTCRPSPPRRKRPTRIQAAWAWP